MDYATGARFRKMKKRLTRIEAKLDQVLAQLGGMTAEEVDQVTRQATQAADNLEAAVTPGTQARPKPKCEVLKMDSNKTGAVPQGLTDALSRINAATTQVATTIQGLRDKISTSMTQQEVTDVQNQLDGLATQLEGMAQDPNNPVPPAPPAPQKKK